MPSLSKEEFTKEFLRCTQNERKIDLPDEVLNKRADVLFILNEITMERFSVAELNETYVFLMELLTGQYPKIAFTVNQNDRIRLPYAALEQIPATKGKLTEHEKMMFAFCAFFSVCVKVYDENTEEIHYGVHSITSYKHLQELLIWEMESHPEKFEFDSDSDSDSSDEKYESSKKFAVSKKTPVKAVSIADGYDYLNNLRTPDGKPVGYERLGSTSGKNGGIIDVYTLYFIKNNKPQTMTIYIDPYATRNSKKAPKGFILANGFNYMETENESPEKHTLFDYVKNLFS